MRPAYLLSPLAPPGDGSVRAGRAAAAESDIVDLRSTPRTERGFEGFARATRSLAETAASHLVAGAMTDARRCAEDALLVIDTIAEPRERADVSVILGDVLLALYEAHRARERFEHAVSVYDEARDLPRAACARVGLSKAMTQLHDATARAVLEDAGTIYEELGDEREVLAIDRMLRELDGDFERGCPMSFHAVRYA